MKNIYRASLLGCIAAAVLLNIGCATKPPFPEVLAPEVGSGIKSVSIAKDVRFPAVFSVPRGGGGILGMTIQIQEERYFNATVRGKVDLDGILADKLRKGLAQKLQTAPFRPGLDLVEGKPGEAEFVLVVDQYGLTFPSFTGIQKPHMKATALLVKNPPYTLVRDPKHGNWLEPEDLTRNPILWMKTVEAVKPDAAKGESSPSVAEYRNDPQMLINHLDPVVSQVLDDLLRAMKGQTPGDNVGK